MIVPSLGSLDFGPVRHLRKSLILNYPDVVLILVGIESNLLLLASGWIHVAVRMEIASLSIVVTKRDAASKSNVCWHVLHPLRVQGGLELRRHETITVARVHQAEEVNTKHGHVEGDRNNDQAEYAGKEVLKP